MMKDEEGGGDDIYLFLGIDRRKKKEMDELRCLHVLYSQTFLLSS